jgi:hypothetical protein
MDILLIIGTTEKISEIFKIKNKKLKPTCLDFIRISEELRGRVVNTSYFFQEDPASNLGSDTDSSFKHFVFFSSPNK